jgi:hypothetical protein
MQVIADQQIPDSPVTESPNPIPAMPTPSGAPLPNLQGEYIHRAAWRAGVLGSLNFAAKILAARAIVLIAVLGGIGLTWTALADPNGYRIGVMAIYAVGAIGGSVWLAAKG